MSRRNSFLSTPTKITGELRRFCSTLAPDGFPLMVKAVPFPGCDLDAEANLTAQIARFGGSRQWGWRLVVWPRVFIQAERHVIWHSPKDELIDITPTGDYTATIAFLPDSAAEASLEPVRRAALSNDAQLARYLDALARGDAGPESTGMDLFLSVVRRFARPDSPCWCGSGRQLRKCHPWR